ncbi:MAG: hypothetical protein ACOC1F_10690 [Myxococcota bacterium]
MHSERDAGTTGDSGWDRPSTVSVPETECNLEDDDGDGLVDDGLAWEALNWQVLMNEPDTSEVQALRLADDSVAFAALATRQNPASSAIWLGLVDASGQSATAVTRALDWTQIKGWGIALDGENGHLLLGYVVAPNGELHLARYEFAEQVSPVGDAQVVPLSYSATRLFDLGWTRYGPVALLGHEDGYARAEWLDRLGENDGWNHKLATIRPTVAKLAIAGAVGWIAAGHSDTSQAAVMAGVIALDGASELVSPRNMAGSGGGTFPMMLETGSPSAWLDAHMWLTHTDDIKVSGIWLVRVTRFNPDADPGDSTDTTHTKQNQDYATYSHSLAIARGNILATSVTSDQVMLHRIGPDFEQVVPADTPTVIEEAREHAVVGGTTAPLVFRVRSDSDALDVATLGCP